MTETQWERAPRSGINNRGGAGRRRAVLWLPMLAGLAALLAVGLFRHGHSGAAAAADAPESPKRLKVLFLGDTGHHNPLDRCRQAFSAMARRGIDLTYTDDLAELNPDTLRRYDCLLLYANWTSIKPEQEKALLDYVAAGGGFAPIHCASYCFLNSPEITALTGGRFKSHGTGVFTETIAAPDHEIMKGLKPIESWDETYVHEMHNEKDRQVLSYRVEGDKKEPYTWVRTHGKGRVFYTAWGHDERTWGNADFVNLLERGLRWASGGGGLDGPTAGRPARYPFEQMEAEGGLPNYTPGRQWGTEGEPIRTMQKPLSPEQSITRLVMPRGFSASLVASEPDVKKPICMMFDERGRLWVAETFDYPNDMQREGEGHDRITICEDTNGDGKADKFTVFADKLSIPTSMVRANGGVVVTQAPQMLFLKDTDGDDKADVRKVLFSGWGTADTHAGPSNLRWGFDNWIYGTCGYSGFRGNVGGKSLAFGQGVFRMKPDGSALEFLGSTTNNTWGLGFSEDGYLFGSTANNDPSFHMAIPNRYYEQVSGGGLRSGRMEDISDSARFWPLTEMVRQMDQHGNYTAGAGHALYTARSLPREFWNSVAFVSEPTGHLIGQFRIMPNGAGFTTRNEFSFLASDDEWTSPIAADVGPDGSVWFIDWYNYIIQHNPIPKGFEKGKGNAYVTPLRDKRHGRVYRVTYKDGKPSRTFDLANAAPAKLLEALRSENQLWRMHAQRLLVERGDASVVPELIKIAADQTVDAIGLNAPAIHALWTLHGLGTLNGADANPQAAAAATGALKHPSAGVRNAAADVLPRTPQSAEALLASKLLDDPDPHVRKAALLALADMPASEAAGGAVYALLANPRNANDRILGDAATIAACEHDAGFLKAAFAAAGAKPAGEAKEPVAADAARKPAVNLMPNPSFEEGSGNAPRAWQPRNYAGQSTATWVEGGRTGSKALKLESQAGSDTSWYTDVTVQPQTDYRLSAWVKTRNVRGAMGALLNVHGTEYRTTAVNGTSDWRKVELTFNTGTATRVSINCLFGGWGRSTGAAWYDDVELVPAASAGMSGPVGRALDVVSRHYAQRAPADSVVATLTSLKSADPALADGVLQGLARGWPEGQSSAPKISEEQAASLQGLYEALRPETRDHLITLASRWGRPELFSAQLAKRVGELRATLADAKAGPDARLDAARRLVAAQDSAEAIDLALKQITPQATPAFQQGVLEALSLSSRPEVPAAVIGRWKTLTPASQRVALNLLLRKSAWTPALLDAIEKGTVNAKDLATEQWQSLRNNPDRQLAARAATLEQTTGRAPNPDKKKLVDALLPKVKGKGDVAHGKEVFTKNCAVCHTIEGQGGKVGPDLTGIGARARPDLLVEILDPNRSVEGTYRQWLAQTKTGDVIAGRLLSENAVEIEVIDATGKTHVLERKDMNRLQASDLSVMPEGFEQLPPQDLADLLEFLATSNVKH
jgi:putative membrane-bound dehydrogenase-like protein